MRREHPHSRKLLFSILFPPHKPLGDLTKNSNST